MTGAHDGLKPSALACRSSCPVQPVAKASRAQGVDSPATQQALQEAMMGGQGSLPAGHPVRVREAVEKAAAARTEEPAPKVQLHCILHPGLGGPPSHPLPGGLSCLSARHQVRVWDALEKAASEGTPHGRRLLADLASSGIPIARCGGHAAARLFHQACRPLEMRAAAGLSVAAVKVTALYLDHRTIFSRARRL